MGPRERERERIREIRKICEKVGKVVTKRSREDPLVLGVVKHFGLDVMDLSFGGLLGSGGVPKSLAGRAAKRCARSVFAPGPAQDSAPSRVAPGPRRP